MYKLVIITLLIFCILIIYYSQKDFYNICYIFEKPSTKLINANKLRLLQHGISCVIKPSKRIKRIIKLDNTIVGCIWV